MSEERRFTSDGYELYVFDDRKSEVDPLTPKDHYPRGIFDWPLPEGRLNRLRYRWMRFVYRLARRIT